MHASLTYPAIPCGRFFTKKCVRGYCFGFNGKEKTDEWNGDGNIYDYGFRIFDPRIGRFLSVDPLAGKFAYYTPYQFAGNKPIWALDLDGLEDVVYWVTYNRNGTVAFMVETGYDILGKGVQRGTYVHVTVTGGDRKDQTYEYYIVPTEPGNMKKGEIGPGGWNLYGSSSSDNGLSHKGEGDGKGGIDGMVTPGGGAEPTRRIQDILGIVEKFVEWIVEIIEATESESEPVETKKDIPKDKPDSVYINTPTGGPKDWVKAPANKENGQKDGDSIIVN